MTRNMKITVWATFTLTAVCLCPAKGAPPGYSDSPAFQVNLAPTTPGNPYSSSDSAAFSLDVRKRNNSGYGDSGSFPVSAVPVGDIDPGGNRDGHVDVLDLLWLVYTFGSRMGDDNYFPAADLYPCPADGQVDVADLLALVGTFGMY